MGNFVARMSLWARVIAVAASSTGYSYAIAEKTYEIVRIGPGLARSVSSGGVVGGTIGGPAFLYSSGTLTFPLLPNVYYSEITGFASNSAWVANSCPPSMACQAVLSTSNGTQILGFRTADDVSSSFEVVGSNRVTGRDRAIYRASSGSIVDISPAGSSYAYATGINDSGIVVGYSMVTLSSLPHAFAWSTTTGALSLPGTSDNVESVALDINTTGVIVGRYNQSWARWSSGRLQVLPLSGGEPEAINSVGQIVGASLGKALLLQPNGEIIDLAVASAAGVAGWDSLSSAFDINDSGQIVGVGRFGGVEYAFLLSPVPEPSTKALLVGGALFALGAAIRRKQVVEAA